LTPLPKGLPGIPEEDRAYINRTYARVLRATQAKLVVLKALEENKEISASQRRYDAVVATLTDRVKEDIVPPGLEPFRDDLSAALELQRDFFSKAVGLRSAGKSMSDVYALSEGREASSRLIAAWGGMSGRYPAWTAETKDSIYHHLCALDLF
jgi:hypothetical protein